ncbi:MAG: S1C family serine protease [Saprospiraceae bacterium]
MQISNDQVKVGLLAILVAIISSIVSVGFYRYFEQKNYWSGQDANYAKYTKFYDAIFSGRDQNVFHSTAPTDFIRAAAVTTPAVVNIKCLNSMDLTTAVFDSNSPSATGSGVVVSPDGYIITNFHVIEDGGELEVTLNDKRKYIAELVGSDPSTDLALLKIEAQNLQALVIGNSDSLQIGEWVLAVGNPFDLNSTVTAGIVSAKARNINILEEATSIESFIQTDAAVNPGNSGGALVNSNGELVGITSAIITYSGQYEGYSFAIPVNLVQKVMKDIKEFGVVQRGFLGISIDDLNDKMAKDLGLSSAEGIYIRSITQGGAGDEAGLLPGDIIVGLNNTNVKSVPEFQELVGRMRPGNQLKLSYFRNGKKNEAFVTLRNKSNSTGNISSKSDILLKRLGIELRNLSTDQLKKAPNGGVVVVSIKQFSIISATNMEPGFIITKINDNRVGSVEQAIAVLEKMSGKVVVEGVYEGYEGAYFYTFRI